MSFYTFYLLYDVTHVLKELSFEVRKQLEIELCSGKKRAQNVGSESKLWQGLN
jgi:hypothetical protein